jgi:glycosyltransferase involved in cell wall biosynthesis
VGSYIQGSNLINTTFETNYINLSTAFNLHDIGKTSWKKFVNILKLYVGIVTFLANNKVDLCYLTINSRGLAWLKELVIVVILKIFNVPLIYHFHNKGVRFNATTFWKKILYKFQFSNSKSILLSELLYNDIAQFVRKKDIYICANGIPEIYHLSKNKTDKGICRILFFSNLIETKGVYVLLEACKILKDKNIPFRCVYIGGEGDISGIQLDEKISQYGLQAFVEYQGKKYDEEKEQAFAESDIFAFPTFYSKETFGLVNLEAMQYALPVISTREGGIPDVVVDGVNGFLIPKQNALALSEKLEILIANPALRNTMGLAGKRMYEEKFTLQIFEHRLVEILQDYLKEKIA